MSQKFLCVIKDNYVIDRVVVNSDNTSWVYPNPHDSVIEDVNLTYGIGDWYERAEGIFYRPINAIPPDWPEELNPVQPTQD